MLSLEEIKTFTKTFARINDCTTVAKSRRYLLSSQGYLPFETFAPRVGHYMIMSGEESDQQTDQQRLFQAVLEGRVRKARIILEASDGKLDSARNDEGHTLLIAACFIKNPSTRSNMVEMLLEHNMQVNRRDLKGRTALSHASQLGHCDVVNLLVRHRNVDPDAFDFKGNTPLIHAARTGQSSVLKILTQNFRRLGLMVDFMNEDGFNALLIAAKNGYLDCCRTLVYHGRASRLIRDRENNRTPIDWIQQHKFDAATVDFLRPKSKFFRVAKLVTSFTKSRSLSVFEKSHMVKVSHIQRSSTVTTKPQTDKKVKPIGAQRARPRQQKSEEGPLLPRRKGPVRADTVQGYTNVTPQATKRSTDRPEVSTAQRSPPPSQCPLPVAKPRRRRTNKAGRVSSLSAQPSTEREDQTREERVSFGQKTSQKGKAKGTKRIAADGCNSGNARSKGECKDAVEASVLEISSDSVSSAVTSVDSITLSERDPNCSDNSSDEI